VDNAKEEGNWHIDDFPEAEGVKGGRMYDIRERILQFTAEAIPTPRLRHRNGETLQTTERESENGKQRCAIQVALGTAILNVINLFDKGLNDWILYEELIKPRETLVAAKRNFGE
jgi:hypothetical protein